MLQPLWRLDWGDTHNAMDPCGSADTPVPPPSPVANSNSQQQPTHKTKKPRTKGQEAVSMESVAVERLTEQHSPNSHQSRHVPSGLTNRVLNETAGTGLGSNGLSPGQRGLHVGCGVLDATNYIRLGQAVSLDTMRKMDLADLVPRHPQAQQGLACLIEGLSAPQMLAGAQVLYHASPELGQTLQDVATRLAMLYDTLEQIEVMGLDARMWIEFLHYTNDNDEEDDDTTFKGWLTWIGNGQIALGAGTGLKKDQGYAKSLLRESVPESEESRSNALSEVTAVVTGLRGRYDKTVSKSKGLTGTQPRRCLNRMIARYAEEETRRPAATGLEDPVGYTNPSSAARRVGLDRAQFLHNGPNRTPSNVYAAEVLSIGGGAAGPVEIDSNSSELEHIRANMAVGNGTLTTTKDQHTFKTRMVRPRQHLYCKSTPFW